MEFDVYMEDDFNGWDTGIRGGDWGCYYYLRRLSFSYLDLWSL